MKFLFLSKNLDISSLFLYFSEKSDEKFEFPGEIKEFFFIETREILIRFDKTLIKFTKETGFSPIDIAKSYLSPFFLLISLKK